MNKPRYQRLNSLNYQLYKTVQEYSDLLSSSKDFGLNFLFAELRASIEMKITEASKEDPEDENEE